MIPEASPALLDILGVSSDPLRPPIRAEIFGPQRFAEHGRSLGETHRVADDLSCATPANTFFPRLRSNIHTLRLAHHYIGLQAVTGYDISPAAEWLLDNFHLIEAQLKEIHEGLPRRYFRTLPRLMDEPLAGLPRVYGVAWAFVAHTDGAFDEELLVHFLNAYQGVRELQLSELWALPTTLRVVLVDNLRRLAERVATNKAAREVANLCCDRIETLTIPAMAELLGRLEARGVGPVFLTQVALRLQDQPMTEEGDVRAAWQDWLRSVLPDLAAQQIQQRAEQAADNLSMSNSVGSLRTIGDADWSDLIARTSVLMQLMLTSEVFRTEQAGTRDLTLHRIEQLARRSGLDEALVARTLLELMHGRDATREIEAVPGHWLHGAGRLALGRALGLQERGRQTLVKGIESLKLPVYLGVLLLATVGMTAWLVQGVPTGWALLVAALMLFPASETVVAVVHRLISESVRPRHLPRLAFADGIPVAHRVMVVIPALLTDTASVRALAHSLLLHRLANPEPNAQFALLTDWADADSETTDSDAELLSEATQAIRDLNVRYPVTTAGSADAAPYFLLLHRARQFSITEQRWIGWERKRGKLEQLIAALAQPGETPGVFMDAGPESHIAAGTGHVLTLDSDTRLPPGRLRELVGVAAHPLNQPQVDTDRGCVVSGYGILQPRIVTPLPAPQDVTLYHELFAGQCGIDPYSAASSEVYQDVFAEGSFSGKGLLNVQALHAVLSARLPEGRVLSHDLLEGSLARCALLSDVPLVEEAPFQADVAAARVHRWTRGDWQLLPFLFGPMRHSLCGVNRWKLFDNLRRSLVAPMSLAGLLVVLITDTVSPWRALALVLAAFSAGPVMGAAAGFVSSREDLARGYFYRLASRDLMLACGGGLWHITQLLTQARQSADAIVRTLFRMAISRRHLLQWTTSAAVQASTRTRLGDTLQRHAADAASAVLLLVVLLAAGTPHPWLAAALCLLWTTSPLGNWWVSRPRPHRQPTTLLTQEQARLEAIARDTWGLFERCVGPEDRHLPPDNLQTLPHDMVAHRTSPTNIGLYMLSVACARQFGWIDTPGLIGRLEATVSTLATLERHRGHFLNWYDTRTGAPLLPKYVSTVDSGNFSGHLLAVAQACLELASDPGTSPAMPTDTARRLQALARDCQHLAWEADFGFLYHRKRRLLHIGYRVTEQQLDPSFYDLLASESRLTSLLAIAKGDVPAGHWNALGRPFYAAGRHAGLRSWSGSMFEYLMPSLVLDEPHGSVLREACHAAVDEQIAYAIEQAVPWGISESAYAGRDHTLAYQYAPQGVSQLALRRTPPGELVVAPYATALAAQIAPRRALLNFSALEALGARGVYGFIEALDFSPSRLVDGGVCTPVSTFMAHHQGMSLVALTNVLRDGAARRWGMADPSIEAVGSLLHERAPREVATPYTLPQGQPLQVLRRVGPGLLREVVPGLAAIEPTHLLSNGRYNVSLRPNGAGWSRWGQTGITRWRDDALRDAFGSFFLLRRDDQPQWVSTTQHPAPDPAAHYQSVFHAERVCFDAAWEEVQVHTTVWVSPEDDIEFRQVEVRNRSDRAMDLELVSAFEVTLSEARADEAHPAFTGLFVQARWQPAQQALVFERHPRLPTEAGLQAAHFLAESDPQVTGLRGQTDRQRWLGRNRAGSQPLASLDDLADGAASDTVHAVPLDTGLDPVCALAVRLHLTPGAKAQLTFATAASDNGSTLQAVIDKYRQPSHIQRASLMSATLTSIRLRALRISPEHYAAVQTLTTALLLNLTRSFSPHLPGAGPLPTCDRRLLWRFGISGDRPIVLVKVAMLQDLGLLRSLSQALRLWSWGALACDLVVVNAEVSSYQMTLQREIQRLQTDHEADSAAETGMTGSPVTTALHVLRAEELSGEELATLQTLARVRFLADGRPLLHHVQALTERHEQDLQARQGTAVSPLVQLVVGDEVVLAPVGSFDTVTGAFRFTVGSRQRPARPWINVLANPGFGTQVSEAGGGYTWAGNSRLNQLTPWSNDPVADPPSEWFLLQDLQTRQVWSASPDACGLGDREVRGRYSVTHGQGFSRVHHRHGTVDITLTWCVDAETAVKQVRCHFINTGTKPRDLRLVGLVEWMMGAHRNDRSTVHTALYRQRLPGRKLTALLATQCEQSAGFGFGTAFFSTCDGAGKTEETDDWTCDRRECFDAQGQPVLPDHFRQRQGSRLDPCAALATRVTLAPGHSVERVFLLGYADSPNAARELATRASAKAARLREDAATHHWEHLLTATTVKTPDALFDVMVNRWLLYQTVSCRLWAKAGFYQAGGATGFRDQLQDAMALAWAEPATLREQILRCAARQFAEGDVQHWWHAPLGAGVRTHFSDDLLWLVQACVHYLKTTGDLTLLDESVPFIKGIAIPPGAEDAYFIPDTSTEVATLYEHAARALDRSMAAGAHGLPLMGSGDWNDGMNRVGIAGRGESVWLAWLVCPLVEAFVPLASERGDTARVQRWLDMGRTWRTALGGPAWDGQWFRRAFFDDGQVLGSHVNAEARIDLIAQAWAVLSNVASPAEQRMAMASADALLADPAAGLIRLLDPPLVHATPSAGYIQAYPPGVRENGGQYSHAGVWALMAQAQLRARGQSAQALPEPEPGEGDIPYRYFTWLSPAHRASHPIHGPLYRLEPYVMAGDVYSQPPHVGRGGWSWYTGSAAWMHRAAIESIFGLDVQGQCLCFRPCLPTHWPRAEITLRREGRAVRFVLVRAPVEVALTAAEVSGISPAARLLSPGASLDWTDLADGACFVIPL